MKQQTIVHIITVLMLLTLNTVAAFELSGSTPPGQRPILLIAENGQDLSDFAQMLSDQGLPALTLYHASNNTLLEDAPLVHDAIEQALTNTSFSKADVISFAKGSLLVQIYANNFSISYADDIRNHVMIAPPLAGESTNCFSTPENNEASIGSELIFNLNQKPNKNISYLSILGSLPDCLTKESADGKEDISSNLLSQGQPAIILKRSIQNITSSQSAKLAKFFLQNNLTQIKPNLGSGETYINSNDPNADPNTLGKGSVLIQLNNITTSAIALKKGSLQFNLNRSQNANRWFYLNDTKTRIPAGPYDVYYSKNNVLKDSGLDITVNTGLKTMVIADSDLDTILDPLDACPLQFGNWCHGCPIASCTICQNSVCPSNGRPFCANSSATTICGSKDCDLLDSACRNYKDVQRFCDGNGTCQQGACTDLTDLPVHTSCGQNTQEYSCALGTNIGSDTAQRSRTNECDGLGTCQASFTDWMVDEPCNSKSSCYWDGQGQNDEDYFCSCYPNWALNNSWSACHNGTQSTNYLDLNHCNTDLNKPGNVQRDCTLLVYSPLDHIYSKKQIPVNLTVEALMEKILYMDNNGRPRTLCSRCDEYGFSQRKFQNFLDGMHNLTIQAFKDDKIFADFNTTFLVDSTKPKIVRAEPKKFSNGRFSIEFIEENPDILQLHVDNETFELSLLECIDLKRSKKCDAKINLSQFEGQEIPYWFSLEDIAQNHAESRPLDIQIDSNAPLITDLSLIQSQKTVQFNISIIEPNLEMVSYLDDGKWKNLCTKLIEGKCVKRALFASGNHSILFNVSDAAKNHAIWHLELEIP